jgi:hypothetical protein
MLSPVRSSAKEDMRQGLRGRDRGEEAAAAPRARGERIVSARNAPAPGGCDPAAFRTLVMEMSFLGRLWKQMVPTIPPVATGRVYLN